jgi:hypothetical protein
LAPEPPIPYRCAAYRVDKPQPALRKPRSLQRRNGGPYWTVNWLTRVKVIHRNAGLHFFRKAALPERRNCSDKRRWGCREDHKLHWITFGSFGYVHFARLRGDQRQARRQARLRRHSALSVCPAAPARAAVAPSRPKGPLGACNGSPNMLGCQFTIKVEPASPPSSRSGTSTVVIVKGYC